MSSNRINVELSDPLIDNHGFNIPSEKFEELFEQDNRAKNKHTHTSRSNNLLLDGIGGTDKVVSELRSDPIRGIDNNPEEIAARKQRYGDNVRIKREIQTICQMIGGVFNDFILQVLCVAAVVSTVIGIYNEGWELGWIEGTSILIAIVIITVVTVSQDYAKEKQFQKMMETDDIKDCRITRNGNVMTIDTVELVVGDLVTISTGDSIPADCILVKSHDMTISESQLTGEPCGKPKEVLTADNFESCPSPFIVQGSLVETGSGTAIVCAVGNRTAQGKAGLAMNMEADSTPLQNKLDTIANTIGKFGTYVAVLTFIAITIRTLCLVFLKHEREFSDEQNLTDILNGFIIAVTIIVVAVPEGLPLAVAIALYVASSQMEKENNLVRRMKAAETMGNANEICTDKTGTLTQNKMTVMEAYYLDQIHQGTKSETMKEESVGDLIAQSICYNGSAFIETLATGEKKAKGNVTEVGIINYLTASKFDCEDMINARLNTMNPLFTIPFSSARKRSSQIIPHPTIAGGVRVYVKGAPDMVLKQCTSIILGDGEAHHLDDDKRDELVKTRVLKSFADKCYRTMLLAYKDYDEGEWEDLKAEHGYFETLEQQYEVETDLTVIAIFALQDPLRPGIADTADILHRAGVNIRMVTGDFIDTAVAISKEAHIITDADKDVPGYKAEYACMDGETFRNLISGKVIAKEGKVECEIKHMARFREIMTSLKVLARSEPNDKFLLVHGLIQEGKTVAVTGDGTNDAPALNRADVGFAMGITGTEVAINSADIKLLDDNFCSIKTAVTYGRNIYDNVKKFLQFQLTVNVVAMFIVFSGSILFEETPLNAVQMLWVNLIMDTLASLALATEPPHPDILLRQPAHREDKIVDQVMWRNIMGHAIYQIIVLLLILFFGRNWFNLPYDNSDPLYANEKWYADQLTNNPEKIISEGIIMNEATNKCHVYTIVFQAFVFMQIFNMVNARKLLNTDYNVFARFCNNPRFIIILVLIIVVQLCLVQFGGRAFKTTNLTNVEQAVCLVLGAFSLVWGLVIKFILPPSLFAWLSIDEKEMEDKEVLESFASTVRGGNRLARTRSIRASQRVSARKSQIN